MALGTFPRIAGVEAEERQHARPQLGILHDEQAAIVEMPVKRLDWKCHLPGLLRPRCDFNLSELKAREIELARIAPTLRLARPPASSVWQRREAPDDSILVRQNPSLFQSVGLTKV